MYFLRIVKASQYSTPDVKARKELQDLLPCVVGILGLEGIGKNTDTEDDKTQVVVTLVVEAIDFDGRAFDPILGQYGLNLGTQGHPEDVEFVA